MYDKLPIVKIYFNISGDYLAFEDINKQLAIQATKTRTKEEWPDAIKDNNDLPDEMRPCYEWTYIEKYEKENTINVALENLIEIFGKKIDVLNSLKTIYELNYSVLITVDADEMNVPEISISNTVIEFLYKIQCDISFDIMTYHDEE